MNIYTNGFNCAMRNDGEEVIIKFLQKAPAFDDSGKFIRTDMETIASLVMNRKTAAGLISSLEKIISEAASPKDAEIATE